MGSVGNIQTTKRFICITAIKHDWKLDLCICRSSGQKIKYERCLVCCNQLFSNTERAQSTTNSSPTETNMLHLGHALIEMLLLFTTFFLPTMLLISYCEGFRKQPFPTPTLSIFLKKVSFFFSVTLSPFSGSQESHLTTASTTTSVKVVIRQQTHFKHIDNMCTIWIQRGHGLSIKKTPYYLDLPYLHINVNITIELG